MSAPNPVSLPATSGEASSNILTSFHCFQRLPRELQYKVWELHHEYTPRDVLVTLAKGQDGKVRLKSRTPLPYNLHLCSISRSQACKMYKPMLGGDVLVIPHLDTIFLDVPKWAYGALTTPLAIPYALPFARFEKNSAAVPAGPAPSTALAQWNISTHKATGLIVTDLRQRAGHPGYQEAVLAIYPREAGVSDQAAHRRLRQFFTSSAAGTFCMLDGENAEWACLADWDGFWAELLAGLEKPEL